MSLWRQLTDYWKPAAIHKTIPDPMTPAAQDGPEAPEPGASTTDPPSEIGNSSTGNPSILNLDRRNQVGTTINNEEERPSTRPGSNWNRRSDPERAFKDKYVEELSIQLPLTERIRAAGAASEEVQVQIHSVDAIMELWATMKDLVAAEAPPEGRRAAFAFLTVAVQHSGLDTRDRLKFFDAIATPISPTDAGLQIRALAHLTQDGKVLSPFEGRLVNILIQWLEGLLRAIFSKRKQRYSPGGGEREGLHLLLPLVHEAMSDSPELFSDTEVESLVNLVVRLCKSTSVEADVEYATPIIGKAAEIHRNPMPHLEDCVVLLCSLSGCFDSLKLPTRKALLQQLSSRHGSAAVKILLKILNQASESRSRAVRGALSILQDLISKNGANQLPFVPFLPLATGLLEACKAKPHFRYDCILTIGFIFDDDTIIESILEDTWAYLFQTLFSVIVTPNHPISTVRDHCSLLEFGYLLSPTEPTATMSTDLRAWIGESTAVAASTSELTGHGSKPQVDPVQDVLRELQHIADRLAKLWSSLDKTKQEWAARFFLVMHEELKTSTLRLLLDYLEELYLRAPLSTQWDRMTRGLVGRFLLNRAAPEMLRCKVVHITEQIYLVITQDHDKAYLRDIVSMILEGMTSEQAVPVINRVADLLICVAHDPRVVDFGRIVDILCTMAYVNDRSESRLVGSGQTSILASCGNASATALVRLFLGCFHSSAEKAVVVHNKLMVVAADRLYPPSARLTAMKLLSRIRCGSDFGIIVVPIPDSLDLAATLCRTEASASQTPDLSKSNRKSMNDGIQGSRIGRTSSTKSPEAAPSRSNTRSASRPGRSAKISPPLWMYGVAKGLPEDPPQGSSSKVSAFTNGPRHEPTLKLNVWLENMISILQQGGDWEIYSYILVHLPSQLSNIALFTGAIPPIRMLRNVVCELLLRKTFVDAPVYTGVKPTDIALCLYHTLTMLLGYRSYFGRSEEDDMVKTFLFGISAWDRTGKCCIHSLTICCYEIPNSVARSLSQILQKLSQTVTQRPLTMDTLEFLGGLAMLPAVHANMPEEELKKVFGICTRHLHHSREERSKSVQTAFNRMSYGLGKHSGAPDEPVANPDEDQSAPVHKDLPQYVLTLAYHVMTFWFLSLKLHDRAKHVGWIAKSMASKDEFGNEIMEEQSQVTLDMMHRTAYSDLGETVAVDVFGDVNGETLKRLWLVGMSIVTIETAVINGMTQLTKRQASGTTHAIYQQHTAPLAPHHIPLPKDPQSAFYPSQHPVNVLPNHVFLQLASTIAPTPVPMQPISLPDDEYTKRAIVNFDRNDTVDGHKVGVIYIDNEQTSEAEILANCRGSEDYYNFVRGLGTKVALKGATFNTQGLDRESDVHGTHTYAWRDRVTEIVFHVTTMMPTLPHDPQCVIKKLHIGNDHVRIIYNDSGLPFNFDTFPSAYNDVNIVITPESLIVPYKNAPQHTDAEGYDRRQNHIRSESGSILEKEADHAKPEKYFRVQTLTRLSFPPISPCASPKIISATALPAFVRQIALNACVFSLVWASRGTAGENISSWCSRLREIKKLRDKYVESGRQTAGGARNELYPETEDPGKRIYHDGDRWAGSVAMGGVAEEEGMVMGLDFSRWAS